MKKRSEKDRISAVLFIVVFLLVVVIVIMVLKTVDDKRASQQTQDQQTINTESYQPPVQDPNALISGNDTVTAGNPYGAVSNLPNANPSTGGGGGGGTAGQTGTAPANNPAPGNNQTPANNPVPAAQPTTAPANPPAATSAPESTPAPANPADPGSQNQTPAQPQQQPVDFVPVLMGSGTFQGDSGTWLNIHADWVAKTSSPTQVEITVTVYCDHQSLQTPSLSNSVNIRVDDMYVALSSPGINQDNNDFVSTPIGSYTFTVDLGPGESKVVSVHAAWGYGGTYGSDKGRVKIHSLECGGGISLSR